MPNQLSPILKSIDSVWEMKFNWKPLGPPACKAAGASQLSKRNPCIIQASTCLPSPAPMQCMPQLVVCPNHNVCSGWGTVFPASQHQTILEICYCCISLGGTQTAKHTYTDFLSLPFPSVRRESRAPPEDGSWHESDLLPPWGLMVPPSAASLLLAVLAEWTLLSSLHLYGVRSRR